ncbi:MAG: M48 family metallopeptidase [Alphaproteobacteria bacterium]|nr:M48 family metallopeptidase [Alphaproteobacteria bacterium]
MRIPRYSGRSRGGLGALGGRLPIIVFVIGGLALYWFTNQKEGLVGGRKQMITMDLPAEVRLGQEAYMQILQSEPVLCGGQAETCPVEAGEIVELVKEVGGRIAGAAREWEAEGAPMTVLGESEGTLPRWGALADKFDWEFNVIASDTPNAFCLPGGKVAIYTGILPTADNVDGLAVIMGHEIGHALARHGAERMSQQQLMQFGQMAIGATVGDMSLEMQRLVMGAMGAGAQVGVLLPFSRAHESEADLIGLELLVRACYDPREAPKLWERMGALGGGENPPDILSTHPNPAQRATAFEAVMPQAIKAYEARCGTLPAG